MLPAWPKTTELRYENCSEPFNMCAFDLQKSYRSGLLPQMERLCEEIRWEALELGKTKAPQDELKMAAAKLDRSDLQKRNL